MNESFSLLRPSIEVPKNYEKQVFITNILAFLFSLVTLGILGILYSLFGWIDTLTYILLVAVLLFFVPLANRWISHRFGRVLFCLIPVWLTMFVTIFFKLESNELLSRVFYFDSRFILMASLVLPGLVFRLEERIQLFLCMGSNSILLLLYDPIHELFGVGFFQRGFNDPAYPYITYIVGVTHLILLFGILLLRSILERSEKNLIVHNTELIEKQNEIEAQHEELLQQQEELIASSEKLEQVNQLVQIQQKELEKHNESLEFLVEEKSFELVRTNEELVKHNNELLQFSYTVSHNLRGPVARMLGLTRLLQHAENNDDTHKLQDMVLRSSEELDEILKDLSLIIDIRNDLYRVREKVFLQDEWYKAFSLLGESVKSVHQLEVDFSNAPYIYGVRPMIQSIFYNLLSNAIKYQSPSRKLKVKVLSERLQNNSTEILISDNGLGLDVKGQKHNLFKLYKRFHSHVSGKGLGLYLVKTQVETLDGEITVEGEPDIGTTFRMVFKRPEEVSRQIFHENDSLQIYYDGTINIMVVQWKKEATSEIYREAFELLLNSLNKYQIMGWISDVRNQGVLSEKDQQWFMEKVLPELLRMGLKRIALIGFDTPERKNYYERLKTFDFEVKLFNSMDISLAWMERSYKEAASLLKP